MTTNRQYIFFAFLFLFLALTGFSQGVRVEAALDTSKMRIGEQVNVDLYVTFDAKLKDLKIIWPEIGDTLSGKVEVVSVSPIDTMFPSNTNSSLIFQHQQITVSVYDSGFYAIPPFKFKLNNDSAYTNPLFLEVHTVPTDTSLAKIKDIKEPFGEPFNWKWYLEYLYWGLAIIALLVILILAIRYYRNKRKLSVAEPEKPKIPPHITALAALEKIKSEQVWIEGKVKEYYSEITGTIRLYIEGRFLFNALESTTDEIMTAFRSQVIDPESKDKLQQLLTLSDLVKFAKLFPVEAEHVLTLQNAFDFVNGTKREEVIELKEGTQGETQGKDREK